MNKEITIYDILGLIKDGNAPKKIRYEGSEYIYNESDKDYQKRDGLMLLGNLRIGFHLGNKVEILEEDKDIELLDTTQDNTLFTMQCYTGIPEVALDWNFDILKKQMNEVIIEVNKLRKEKK